MVQRAERVAGFVSDRAPAMDAAVELLCEDHVGTYTLPFLCVWSAGAWANAATGRAIEAEVIGWREAHAKCRRLAALSA